MAPHNELIKQKYEQVREEERIEEIFEMGLNFHEVLKDDYRDRYDAGFESKNHFMAFVSREHLNIPICSVDEENILTAKQYSIWREESGEVIQLVILKENELEDYFSEEEINILSLDYNDVMSKAQSSEKEEEVLYKNLVDNRQIFIRKELESQGDYVYLTYLTAKPNDSKSEEYISQVLSEF